MQRMKVGFYNMTRGTSRVVDSRSVDVKHQGGGVEEAAEAKAIVTAWATAKGWDIQIICVLWVDSTPALESNTEEAQQAGMAGGCSAYNEAIGSSLERQTYCLHCLKDYGSGHHACDCGTGET